VLVSITYVGEYNISVGEYKCVGEHNICVGYYGMCM
jgi:hypothetical protein